jgi:hypothetical protein
MAKDIYEANGVDLKIKRKENKDVDDKAIMLCALIVNNLYTKMISYFLHRNLVTGLWSTQVIVPQSSQLYKEYAIAISILDQHPKVDQYAYNNCHTQDFRFSK